MRPTDEAKQYLKNVTLQTNPVADKAVLDDLFDQLDTAKGAQEHTPKPNIWRPIMLNRITKLSTAAAAVLIISLVLSSIFVPTGVTFADVIKPLFEAQTFAFDIHFGGADGPAFHDRVSGNRIRRTIDNPKSVMIIDADAGKMLRLDTAGKTAVLIDISGPIKEHARNYIALVRETIKRFMAESDFELEEKSQQQTDGRKTVEYSLSHDGERVTIQADAKTGQLLQIEVYGAHILKNIEFDISISEEEVSLTPPAGYKMRQADMDLSNLSEKDLVEGLRVWAKYLRDGDFPPELTKRAYVEQIPLVREKVGALSIPDTEKETMGKHFMQSMFFLQTIHMNQQDWHYAGQGVQLGDSESAIFWYQPKDSTHYRVIYGDLSVQEVAPENLPK